MANSSTSKLIIVISVLALVGSVLSLSRSRQRSEEEAQQLGAMRREVAQMSAEVADLRRRAELKASSEAGADAGP